MMKKLLYIFLAVLTLNAAAQTQRKQQKIDISKSFSDDGKTLRIKISGTKDGKAFKFEKNYQVKNLNTAQKDSIKTHVLDSLGVN